MKLNARQATAIEDRFGVEAVEEDDPALARLTATFGDHTFFLDADGLSVIEPHPEGDGATGVVVKLASWTEDRGGLKVQEPEALPVSVDLNPDGSDPAS